MRAQENAGQHAELRLLLLAHAFGGVARGDMADLVAKHAGHFRLVDGKAQQAAGDVDIAAGQRKGVDVRGIEHGEGVFDVLALGGRRHELADAVDIGVEGRLLGIGAAEFLARILGCSSAPILASCASEIGVEKVRPVAGLVACMQPLTSIAVPARRRAGRTSFMRMLGGSETDSKGSCWTGI